jgi:hypothetical protein
LKGSVLKGSKGMGQLWPTLVEFLFRLGAGLALTILIVSAQQVNCGFFRIHSWILMGLTTFASLVLYSQAKQYDYAALAIGLSVAAAVVSYVAAVIWMYERRVAGKTALGIVLLLCVAADNAIHLRLDRSLSLSENADFATGSLILGALLTAMLLGHWYLNFPGMKLEPLKVLVIVCAAAIAARTLVAGLGVSQLATLGRLPASTIGWSFLAFRWLTGLICPGIMVWLTWETLKVPNTQSATGILYAAVTLVFLGELTAQLLSLGLDVPI